MAKKQTRFCWSCSSMVIKDATQMTPLAHEWTTIFKPKLYTIQVHPQGKISFLNIHIHNIYINKGCNFIITIVHSARAKKSLSKSFLGLQLFGFRLSQTETFFFSSQLNFLQYKNLEITNLKRKLFELAKIRSGDKGSFTMLSWVKQFFFTVCR